MVKVMSSCIQAGAVFTKVPSNTTLHSSTVCLPSPSNISSSEAISSVNESPAWQILETEMSDIVLHQP